MTNSLSVALNHVNPLNLYDIFINEIFGTDNIWLFLVACFFIISYLSSRFRVPNNVALTLYVLFILCLGSLSSTFLLPAIIILAMYFTWYYLKWTGRFE